ALRIASGLAQSGLVSALVTAPVCKEALHLAGEQVEGQTELLARWDGADRYEMLATAGLMRVMLLSRHLPLRDALDQITTANVLDHLHLLTESLNGLGFDSPKLALAGLNPHAGENGVIGSEEQSILQPAVLAARAAGLSVSDPQPPDTIFIRAARGEFDAVLALYHDQAFIPLKLAGASPDVEPLTTIAGLSYVRVSPAHGTAFDIAGKHRADPQNLIAAILQAVQWSRTSAANEV
ncbi:MAG: 4-hydroxy-L-threonine phosphate dehydrogenase PdxA, partial [Planctomycetota bacterium]